MCGTWWVTYILVELKIWASESQESETSTFNFTSSNQPAMQCSSFSVRPIIPPSHFTAALSCFWAWSMAITENVWPVLLTVNLPDLNSDNTLVGIYARQLSHVCPEAWCKQCTSKQIFPYTLLIIVSYHHILDFEKLPIFDLYHYRDSIKVSFFAAQYNIC